MSTVECMIFLNTFRRIIDRNLLRQYTQYGHSQSEKKLRLGDKYHRTYIGGPESASIKNFWIAPKFFFCFTLHKKLNRSCSLNNFFLFIKKKLLV